MQSLIDRREGTIVGEVLVAGGGVAGVAAAISAARKGCRVILVERSGRLGGTGTHGMLRTICGLYAGGSSEPGETLNPGVTREIAAALLKKSPRRTVQKAGKVFVLPYESADLEQVLGELCRNEQGIEVIRESVAIAVTADCGTIDGILVDQKGMHVTLRTSAVIDCTGSGEIGFLAGAEFDCAPPNEIQMAGYTVRVSGLQGQDQALSIKVPFVLAQAVEHGQLSSSMRFTAFHPGDAPEEGYLKFSTEEQEHPDRETRVRGEVSRAMAILAARLPSFREAVIREASGVLDREGRRIRGEYVLSEEDVLSAKKFSDGVVKNSWPIELWDRTKGPVYRYVPQNDYYEIPFRCLKVKGFHNLLTAGRCISVSHQALGSVRVMGACIALGEAAGRAAAELVRSGQYPAFGK
ncbi:MAG TPA: FAD-dependent oxidoreductase [Nitrospirota bacterium]|nr:FAD-dependent oxidoreductase [Nitrospirota bacterium]